MRKTTYSTEIRASSEVIWKLLMEKVSSPQGYLPGGVQSRIIEQYSDGFLREVKTDGMTFKEKISIDQPRGEIHSFLIEHPHFLGRVVKKLSPISTKDPEAPLLLTVEVDWTPKDDATERWMERDLPNRVESEVLSLKNSAENPEPAEGGGPGAYAFGKTVELSFGEAETRVREALAQEGFGVLTEIDVKEKFQEKLQKEFRPYKILGACNPAMAWDAFEAEIDIGTLLPCNVALYAVEEGKTAVKIMDPVAALSLVGNAQLTRLAQEARERLQRVLSLL